MKKGWKNLKGFGSTWKNKFQKYAFILKLDISQDALETAVDTESLKKIKINE